MKYNESKIYYSILTKVLSDGNVSCLTVFTDDFLNTSNNETDFPELKSCLKNHLRLKFQKYLCLNTWIFGLYKSPLGFSIDKTDHIMELVNKWSQAGNIEKPIHHSVNTPHMKMNS